MATNNKEYLSFDSDVEESAETKTSPNMPKKQKVLEDSMLGLSTYPDPENPATPPRESTDAPKKKEYLPSPTLTNPSFEVPKEQARPRSSRRCYLLALVAFCIIAAAIAVPLALHYTKGDSSSANQSESSTDTNTNTDADGGMDTNDGSSTTTAPLKDSAMLRVIQSVTPSNVLEDETTPQSKAARWLQEEDESYDQENDEYRLQRYVLALLDFHFHPEATQPTIGRALVSECEWEGIACGPGNYSLGGGANWTDANSTTGLTVTSFQYDPSTLQNTTTIIDTTEVANTTTIDTSEEATASSLDPNVVTKLLWAEQSLTGNLPTEIALLTSLQYLDLGNNALTGSIPETLFVLTNLEYLYLHENQLGGSLSTNFARLGALKSFYAGDNQLTGSIPRELGSPSTGVDNVRPLRYLSLYNNKLTGSIPLYLNLRDLFYLDLSFNELTGTIPNDWVDGSDDMESLRNLYLDQNKLSGPMPALMPTLGSSRLEQLFLSNNAFTGTFPGGYTNLNFLFQLEIYNNSFAEIDYQLCDLIVFYGGENVNLRIDCEICTCQLFCDTCI